MPDALLTLNNYLLLLSWTVAGLKKLVVYLGIQTG